MIGALNDPWLVDYDGSCKNGCLKKTVTASVDDMTAAIVLAGGKSRRLGKNKLLESVGGRSLLQRVIDSLVPVSRHIFIVTAQGQGCPEIDVTETKVECIHDIYPEKGALGGIYTGLLASDSQRSLVAAADMPFLNPALLHHLLSVSRRFDIVMPRVRGDIEPLHAVYSRDCLPLIHTQLERNQLQIRVLLDKVRVRYVEEAEIERFDPSRLSFFNVNTPNDLEEARRIAAEVGRD
ncbi:MAG: molybdenum cofactor guanylyltransferase [Dehalococcoidia bacterium]|nr:molybdenum cofactor guanylyltransferase [Dehalococcoidia bacterium]